MAELRAYQAGDLGMLRPRREQIREWCAMMDQMPPGWTPDGPVLTLADRGILAIFGLEDKWPGVAQAWALFSRDLTMEHWKQVTRAARAALAASPLPRIEATVRADFAPGQRYLDYLGFHCETPDGMENWAFGRTHLMYARAGGAS